MTDFDAMISRGAGREHTNSRVAGGMSNMRQQRPMQMRTASEQVTSVSKSQGFLSGVGNLLTGKGKEKEAPQAMPAAGRNSIVQDPDI